MPTTRHRVDLRYRPDDLQAAFAAARREDLEVGGRYDVRSAAIQIWTHHWRHVATRAESDRMGTFYFRWADHHTLWEIECADAFSPDDLRLELGALEHKALGRKVHGG